MRRSVVVCLPLLLLSFGTPSLGAETLWARESSVQAEERTFSSWGAGEPAVLAEGEASVSLSGGSVRTLGEGAPGLLVSGPGARAGVTGVEIRTSGDGAAGVKTASGGTVQGKALGVLTLGGGAPAVIAEGPVTTQGGVFRTLGSRSPAVLSAGALGMAGAVVVGRWSEGAMVLGAHSLSLSDSSLVAGAGAAVVFAREASGDPGTGTLTVSGGSLAALAGPGFQVDRSPTAISLRQTLLVLGNGILVQLAAGGSLTLTASAQVLSGNLVLGTRAALALGLKEGSSWTGATDDRPESGTLDLSIDSGSSWTVTGDSRVGTLVLPGGLSAGGLRSIRSGGHKVWYRAESNSWLGKRVWPLDGGGTLEPY